MIGYVIKANEEVYYTHSTVSSMKNEVSFHGVSCGIDAAIYLSLNVASRAMSEMQKNFPKASFTLEILEICQINP